ncbi:HAD family hydrolase [Amycolatopsis sp. NPDC059657]|uniref:HAD family hydrolase n=1 Tax=Amycolatopsis sp. NPDC059657 TaxID=3346899 RepID=UPI00366D379B
MDAVVFDLDGVLVDSEQIWDEVRRAYVAGHGGTWTDEATRAQQGMSTPEWAEYLAGLGVSLPPERIAEEVIERMVARYAAGPPVIAGGPEAVRAVGAAYPVAIASSSPQVLITSFLVATGLEDLVKVALSSEKVAKGKPAPDVYLEATRLLGVDASRCAAVEDTTNGLKAALAAGMTVYAVPNPHFPPDPAVLAQAAAVLGEIGELPGIMGL